MDIDFTLTIDGALTDADQVLLSDARTDLGPTPFVLAGLLALAIAVGTIAGHAVRVARTNPIHALRYE